MIDGVKVSNDIFSQGGGVLVERMAGDVGNDSIRQRVPNALPATHGRSEKKLTKVQ